MRTAGLAAALVAACFASGQSADAHSLAISAVVLSKSNCRFSAANSTLSLAIDPASTAPASASAGVSFRCMGTAAVASWSVANGSGLHGAGPSSLRMRHASTPTEFLPYALAYPALGTTPKNSTHTITVTATVAASAFQSALPGTYSDSVSLTLLP
jgi:hypothetical protein